MKPYPPPATRSEKLACLGAIIYSAGMVWYGGGAVLGAAIDLLAILTGR